MLASQIVTVRQFLDCQPEILMIDADAIFKDESINEIPRTIWILRREFLFQGSEIFICQVFDNLPGQQFVSLSKSFSDDVIYAHAEFRTTAIAHCFVEGLPLFSVSVVNLCLQNRM